MNKKGIIIGISVVVVIVIALVVVSFAFLVPHSADDTGSLENENLNTQVADNESHSVDKIYNNHDGNVDNDKNAVDNNSASAPENKDVFETSSTNNDDNGSSVAQETINPERQSIALDAVQNAFNSGNNYFAASSDDIPQALRNKENWVYLVATGGNLDALLGGSNRTNIRILDTKVSSQSPEATLYSITYQFTAVPKEAMDASGAMNGRDGKVTALVRVSDTGKVVQYSEEMPEWL